MLVIHSEHLGEHFKCLYVIVKLVFNWNGLGIVF